jgi:hypothetical protein
MDLIRPGDGQAVEWCRSKISVGKDVATISPDLTRSHPISPDLTRSHPISPDLFYFPPADLLRKIARFPDFTRQDNHTAEIGLLVCLVCLACSVCLACLACSVSRKDLHQLHLGLLRRIGSIWGRQKSRPKMT